MAAATKAWSMFLGIMVILLGLALLAEARLPTKMASTMLKEKDVGNGLYQVSKFFKDDCRNQGCGDPNDPPCAPCFCPEKSNPCHKKQNCFCYPEEEAPSDSPFGPFKLVVTDVDEVQDTDDEVQDTDDEMGEEDE